VIHLRAFGPSCEVRVRRALARGRQAVPWLGRERREVRPHDICSMSNEYVVGRGGRPRGISRGCLPWLLAT